MKSLFESSLDGALSGITDRLERLYSGEVLGLPTGFADLDELVTMEDGALVVLGARPAMGKTALMLAKAVYVAVVLHRPVLLFSLEMGRMELTQRLACILAGVSASSMKKGDLTEREWSMLNHAFARLFDAPLWIEDDTSLTVSQMKAQALELKEQVGDIGLVAVDYIQLMSGERNEGRQVEVSDMSRGLKIMARELGCPVYALSQLNRGLEQRVDKRPMLSDLRESGSIEQDADIVMFIYRDDVYNPDSEDKGTAEVLVSKQRNGPTGMVRLSYLAESTKFDSLKGGK